MEQKDNNRPPRRGRKAFLIVGIILLVLLAVVIAYAVWERPPEVAVATPKPAATPTPTVKPTEKPDDPTVEPTPTPEPDPFEQIEVEPLITGREEGSYTFLLVGRDVASNSTDTIIVARMDTKKHCIDCVSIPRDTLINIAWASTPKKINAV